VARPSSVSKTSSNSSPSCDGVLLNFTGREREIAVRTIAAEDIEAENAPQLVVEEDVHDDAEANIGIANGSAFDRAGAKTPVHRPWKFPHRGG
jgi:hypothetical protein